MDINTQVKHFNMSPYKTEIYIGKTGSNPLGIIWAACSQAGLIAVDIGVKRSDFIQGLEVQGFKPIQRASSDLNKALEQISDYLYGHLQTFDLKINWDIFKSFQRQVLKATYEIPYGRTMTYLQIAEQIGRPRAARAVGRAEATNPMPLVIPCHRVIGSDGKLHGYGAPGGIGTKAWLLQLEGARLQ
jgi:methylated-DNA-[protein]-cysteine S-methyltransferase